MLWAYIAPPQMKNFDDFCNLLTELLIDICDVNRTVIIAGDFNIDILTNNRKSRVFLDILECFSIKTLFKDVTRKAGDSATCIDNICTNGDHAVTMQIIKANFTDHYAQNVAIEIPSIFKCKENVTYKEYRDTSPQNVNMLIGQ